MSVGNKDTEIKTQTTQELIKNTIKMVHGMEVQAKQMSEISEEVELKILKDRAVLVRDLPGAIKEIATNTDTLSEDDLLILEQISEKAKRALELPEEKTPRLALSAFLIPSPDTNIGEPNLLEIFYNRVYLKEE